MAYSQNFPAQRPSFMFDASNAGRLDNRISFSRASTGTFFGTEKVLSSENLILQSENFTTTWAVQDASGAAGATAPDGGTDGYTVTAHSGSSKGPRVSQSLSGKLSTSTQYTMVGHVKAGTATHGYISFRGTNSNNYAYAQIQFSSPGSVSTGGAGFTSISGTVTALGSSWYKLTLTATTGSDVSGAFAFIGVNDGTAFGISGYPAWTSAGETLEVWGAQISSTNTKIYDSPTTTQIARSYQTKLQTAASGAARFEYSTDGQSEGILVESQFQELLTYTEDLTNAAYTKSNLTIGSNAAISPDGTLTADLCTESDDSSGQDHSLIVTSPTLSAATHTLSVFAKSAGRSHVQLQAYMGSIALNCQATYSLTDGSVSGLTNATGSAESLGNGWYRLKMHFTPTGSAVAGLYFRLCSDASTNNYTGNGYSGAIMWGANLTQSSHAYSYLKADVAATTKAADSLSCVLSDVGYTGGPFSLGADFSLNGKNSTANGVAAVQDSSSNALIINVGSDNLRAFADVAGATAINTTIEAGVTTDTDYSVFARWDTNDYRGASNGTLGNTDTVCPLPAFDSPALHIGGYLTNYELNGHVKRVALYNEALTDTNLQALTS